MPFWRKKKLTCEFCKKREATRKVWVGGTRWDPICEECFKEKFKGTPPTDYVWL
ncbi:MAG: hypothetical protein ACTSUS_09430 [Candidatus Freyarchaeota archaeon]